MGNRVLCLAFYLSIAVICLFYSQTKAQDTIVLKNGSKIIGKNVYVQNKIYYRNYKDTSEVWHTINKQEISYIRFATGDKTFFSNPKDSNKITRIKYFTFYLNACIGFPDIWYNNSVVFPFSTNDGISYQPYYGFSVDFKFDKNFSIGAIYGVESVYRDENFDSGATYIHRKTQAKVYSLNLRGLYNISFLKICSCYVGLGAGSETYNGQVTFTGQPESNISGTALSFLAFAGIRVLLKNKIGIHVEAAYGVPYLVEAGITYAINFKLSSTQ